MGKATDFKFGEYIYRANPNKSPLKILEKRERGRIQGLPNFFGYPLLSQERVKLRTSNFVGTFIGSIRTKAHKNCKNSSRGRSQGVSKIFRAPTYRVHCAGIFAMAGLSHEVPHWLYISKFTGFARFPGDSTVLVAYELINDYWYWLHWLRGG